MTGGGGSGGVMMVVVVCDDWWWWYIQFHGKIMQMPYIFITLKLHDYAGLLVPLLPKYLIS